MGVNVSTVQEERPGRRCERNGPEGVEMSTVDRQLYPENRRPARKTPGTEGISPKSRGDERTEITERRVGGKTAPVTARWGRAVAGRQAGGGGGTCRRDTRTEI